MKNGRFLGLWFGAWVSIASFVHRFRVWVLFSLLFVSSVEEVFDERCSVVLQNEVPEAANLQLAASLPSTTIVILNAAPARSRPPIRSVRGC